DRGPPSVYPRITPCGRRPPRAPRSCPAGRPYGIEGAHHARGPRRLHHHPRRLRVRRGVARLLGPGGPGVPGLAQLPARGQLPDGGEHVPADVRVRGGRGAPGPGGVLRGGGGLPRPAHQGAEVRVLEHAGGAPGVGQQHARPGRRGGGGAGDEGGGRGHPRHAREPHPGPLPPRGRGGRPVPGGDVPGHHRRHRRGADLRRLPGRRARDDRPRLARWVDDYGPTTALLAQLDVTHADGTTASFGTDGTWRSAPSHILGADLVAGEVHDLRRRRDWRDRASWAPVRVEDHGYAELVEPVAPPVRRVEELRPASVTRLRPGCWVVDVGQNVNGWVRLGRLGPAGTAVTLTYGEWLDRDGDVTQEHLRARSFQPDTVTEVPFQTDVVISAGRPDDVFEPRHSTKGFQYVRVEGALDDLTVDDVTAVVVHTDLTRLGDFACSDERINRLHRMCDWSFRGNACDVPTDCPTRERAGWTGDWQIFVEAAAHLYDVRGFNRKWLRDLAADQRPDGRVTNIVPEPHPGDDRPPAFWPRTEGSA